MTSLPNIKIHNSNVIKDLRTKLQRYKINYTWKEALKKGSNTLQNELNEARKEKIQRKTERRQKKEEKEIKQRKVKGNRVFDVTIEFRVWKQYKRKTDGKIKEYDFIQKWDFKFFNMYHKPTNDEIWMKVDHEWVYPRNGNPDYENFILIDIVKIISMEEQKPNPNIKREDLKMKHVAPIKLSHIKIDTQFEHGECVINALLHRYQPYIKKLTREKLIELLKIEDEIEKGIDSKEIFNFCKHYNISMYAMDYDGQVFKKYISTGRHYPPLLYYCTNEHMYMIEDKRIIENITKSHAKKNDNQSIQTGVGLATHKEKKEREIKQYDNLIILKEEEINEDLTQYENKQIIIEDCPSVEKVVVLLFKNYERYVDTKAKFSNGHPVSIYYEPLNIRVEGNPNHREDIKPQQIINMCKQFNILFQNQSYGALIHNIQDGLVNGGRIHLSNELKNKVYDKCNSKCIKCNIEENLDIDHIKPLCLGGSNELDNLQLLCKGCHSEKCKEERENGPYFKIDKIVSSYNGKVKKIINSDLFQSWAFVEKVNEIDETKELKAIDINKCRKNVLYNSKFDFPIYTVMDYPTVFKVNDKIECGYYYVESENIFPLRGNGWYCEPMIKKCLECKIIYKEQIKYKLIPSLKIEKNYFNKLIDKFYTIEDEMLKKLSVNSMIGMFAKQKIEHVKARFSCDPNEIALWHSKYGDSFVGVIDRDIDLRVFKENKTIQKEDNLMPVFIQIIQMENIEIFELSKMIKHNGGLIHAFSTDCVKYYGPTFKIDQVKYKFEEPRALTYERMARYKRINQYVHEDFEFKVEEDRDGLYETEQNIEFIKDKCVFINGPAGTGKTTLIKEYVENFEKNEYIILCPTNKSCRQYNGLQVVTLDKFFISHLQNSNSLNKVSNSLKLVIVDEIGMVCERFYRTLLNMKTYNDKLQMILAGDSRQLQAVNDRISGDYTLSYACYELVDGNILKLNKCRRVDGDNKFFNDYCNPQQIKVKDYKHDEEVDLFLCYTNKTRKRLNEMMMKKYETKESIFLQATKDEQSQDVILSNNMPIIAKKNCTKMDIYNNEDFKIIKCNKDELKIVDETGNKKFKIKTEDFHNLFYPAYALTTHKSQGATYNKHYTICEWNIMDDRLKYVSMSRAKKAEFVNINP